MNQQHHHQQPQQKPAIQSQLDQMVQKINEQGKALEDTILRDNQHQQIIEQYRSSIYTLELKFDLFVKMFEEKGLFAKDEFNKRWPLYLQNDVGVMGPDGKINGSLKVTMYEGGR